MHSTTEFATTVLSKCVTHAGFVKQSAFFQLFTYRSSECWAAARCSGESPFHLNCKGWKTSAAITSFFQWCSRDRKMSFQSWLMWWKAQDMLSRCGHFLFGFLVRFNCARNLAGECWQPYIGLIWLPRASSLTTIICIVLWMHRLFLTRSLLFPYLMCAPVLGQVWSFACRGRFGSRLVGCVRRFRPPPLLWSVFGPSSLRFFFSLTLSGFARSGLGVGVLSFFLSSFVFPVSCPG